jgi:hypothetical protein
MNNEQKNRDFLLTLLTEKDRLIKILQDMPAKDFVELHQETFKDHYLTEPPFLVDDSILDDLDLFDIIPERYCDFFNEIGFEAAYKWLNPSLDTNWSEHLKTEDWTADEVRYVMGLDFDGDIDYDALSDKEAELYGEQASGWATSWFVYELYNINKKSHP